jgi:putative transposase
MQYKTNIIGKILTPVNRRKFRRFVDKYNGDFAAKKLSCWEQFVAICLGQIGNCSSLREIENTVNFHSKEQYHLGLKKNICRSTLANANSTRDWRIYRDLFLDLIGNLKEQEKIQTKGIIEIIDSTPILLNLSQHKWCEQTRNIKGLKVHVLFNSTENIPTYFTITSPKVNDITEGRKMEIKRGCTYVFDKGYTDYNWYFEIEEKGAFFVTRLKRNAKIQAVSELQETNETISSQIIQFCNKVPRGGKINNYHKKPLKKVIVQREGKSPLILITNDFKRSDEEISALYKKRWQIELFFKWIKQNLKIKKFLGKSENAIKTQICIAMISFVLLRLAQIVNDFCKNMSLKTLITIAKNGLFSRLTVQCEDRKHQKNPNQLQFLFANSA